MCTLGPTERPNGVRKGPRRNKNGPQDPTGPIRAYFGLFWGGGARPEIFLSPFGPKKAKFGVKNLVFLKYVFSYKMTFPSSSDHFSLGSKWFWYLQNDKMYTLGPTDRPCGGQKRPPNPTGRIRAYFGLFFWGGPGPKFF